MGSDKPTDVIAGLLAGASTPAGFARAYLDHVSTILAKLDTSIIQDVIQVILDARDRDATIYLFGNGGSAATASHFANDLALAVPPGSGRGLRATALSDSAPILSAIGNDHGFDQVFARQLAGRLRPGDVVIAISASGNSPNILAATAVAREVGAVAVGLIGFGGGELRAACDYAVVVPSQPGEYGPVEAVHLLLEHVICNYIALRCAQDA